MASHSLYDLSEKASEVVTSLGWEIYHTPENLTLFLLGEAAELGEFCQWTSRDELVASDVFRAVQEEMADVVKSVLYLVNVLRPTISLESIVKEKLLLDQNAYPVNEYRGFHRYRRKIQERRKEGIPPLPNDSNAGGTPLLQLQELAWKFVTEREWDQFYSPASLALAVCVKSGEVATCYQRRPKPIEAPYTRMLWAMADILLNVLRLAEHLNIRNLEELVLEKLKGDQERFAWKGMDRAAQHAAGAER